MLNIFKKNTKFDRNIGSNLPLYYDNINVEGKTTQETRSGKNLFNVNTATPHRDDGRESVVIENGVLTITALTTTGAQYAIVNIENLDSTKNYTLSFKAKKIVSGTDGAPRLYFRTYGSNDNSTWTSLSALGTATPTQGQEYSYDVTVTGYTYYRFYIYNNSGNPVTVGEQTQYYDIQFEEGNTVTEYEPYGQMPSPDFSSELVSVGYENLLNLTSGTYSSNGITAIVDNGIITLNGTATNVAFVNIPVSPNLDISLNDTITISLNNPIANSDVRFRIDNQGKLDTPLSKVDTVSTIIVNYALYGNAIRMRVDSGITLNDFVLQPIINFGTESHKYIPYGKYGIEIKKTGKNLFSSEMELGTISSSGVPGGTVSAIRTKDFIEVLPNIEYTVKNSLNYANYRYEYDENMQFLKFTSSMVNPLTFTTQENTKYIKFRTVAGNVENDLTSKWQLEKGSQATNYEPYTSHTNLITLDEPLRGIGDVKDLLYIKNNILYIKRNIKSVKLDGSESWKLQKSKTSSTYFHLNNFEFVPVAASALPKALCSHFTANSGNHLNADEIEGFTFNTGACLRISVFNTIASTVNELQAWLSNNNIEVVYIPSTPTIETYELEIQPMIYESLGNGTLSDVINDPLITEELNGSYILEFEYLKDGKFSEYLVEENIVKAHGEPFSIYSVKKDTESKIKILAKHWVLNEWTKDFILDSEPTNLPAQSALEWIQNRSINHSDITINGDCTDAETARYVRKNMLDAIFNEDNAILKRFGGELSYNVNNVTVNNHRGNISGLTIRQGKNLKGAEYYLDFSTVVTRLVPVGKDGLMLDDVYVDSPLINNYATPIIKKVEVDSDDPAELENYCNKLFEDGIDKPSISIKIDFIELSKTIEYQSYSSLETAHLGDTVNVYIPSLNLNISTRVVKTVYNDNLHRITSLELGNTMPNIATSNVNTQKQLEKQAENDMSVLAEAKQAATEMINHPFSGHLFIDETTGNLYIMDTTDINTAQNIWRWGLGGLGFSSNGINGPYAVAMTQDGKIVADFITTGILQSIEIRATTGTVGGFTLNPDKFTANISKEYNFTLTDVQKAVDYANGTGTLTDEELDEYDVNGDGVVDKLDANTMLRMYYEYISNIINGTLEFNSTDSRRVITLKDGDGNISTSLGLNGIKTKALNCENLSLGGNNVEPQSILSNWYSTSSETLKNAQKHKLLIILAKPASTSAITSISIPTDILTTSNQQFQCADEAAYVSFNLKYSDDDIIITGAGRSSNGTIVKVYTMM